VKVTKTTVGTTVKVAIEIETTEVDALAAALKRSPTVFERSDGISFITKLREAL
jgi:hypothetical protein